MLIVIDDDVVEPLPITIGLLSKT